jgi:hypothetical protein
MASQKWIEGDAQRNKASRLDIIEIESPFD